VRRPGGSLAIGGAPRVDLMPPEIRVKRSQLRLRRSLRLGLFAVAGVVVLACGGTVAMSTLSNVGLQAAQSQEASLLQQQNQFADVKSTTQSIQLIKAGQQVGASTEIDWSAYLASARALLPGGVGIDQATVDQATPVKPYPQTLTSLQGARIATLTIVTSSADIPPVAQILASMEGLPGFTDVSPATVVWDEGTATYKSTLTLHINEKAFDGRFQPTASPAPTAGGKG
jgi:Tfp pilus assembly protein PilN